MKAAARLGGVVTHEDYYAANADWWPETVEILVATGKPWPRGTCLQDLRWWADQQRRGFARFPGRSQLVKRWCRSDYEVRQLLKAEAEWHSPLKNAAPVLRFRPAPRPKKVTKDRLPKLKLVPDVVEPCPEIDQTSTNDPPTVDQTPTNGDTANADNPPEIDQGSTNDVPEVAQTSPHARTLPSPSPSAESESLPPTPVPLADLTVDPLVRSVVQLLLDRPPTERLQEQLAAGDELTGKWLRTVLRSRFAFPAGTRLRLLSEAAKVALPIWRAHPPLAAPADVVNPPLFVDEPAPPEAMDPAIREGWERFLAALRDHVRAEDIDIWFRDARPGWADGRFEVRVANALYADWIHENYLAGMRLAARAVLDCDDVAVTWGASGKVPLGLAPPAPISAAVPTARRLVLPSAEGDGLNDGGEL